MQNYKKMSTFASIMKVKMIFLQRLFRHYPISFMLIAIIWILCFMDVPETPLSDISFMDKWTHFAMYGSLCAAIWVESVRHHGRSYPLPRLLLVGWLLPVLMSGLIEILQATCTGGRRSGDWLDFAANSVGAVIGVAIGILLVWCFAKGGKD